MNSFRVYRKLVTVIKSCKEPIAGGVTFKHVVLGTISGAGLLLKTLSEIKDYKTKIEMCKFAFTTYDKVLVDLQASLRELFSCLPKVDHVIKSCKEPIVSVTAKHVELIFAVKFHRLKYL